MWILKDALVVTCAFLRLPDGGLSSGAGAAGQGGRDRRDVQGGQSGVL